MSTRSCPRLAWLIFAMITGIAWTATAQSISPGAVTLNQIDFRGGPNSVVGEITIDYGLAGDSGFVNVLNPSVPSDSGWLVRNLPVFDPSTGYDHGSITTRLDLTQFAGNGVDVTSAYLIIDYNPSPSATRSQVESHGASANIFPVGSVKVAIGGTGPGGEVTGYQAPPSLIDVQFTVLGIPPELIYQLKHPNIQAGRNQCAPAAVANSLQFLENTILLSIPHLNLPGWGGDMPNTTLVGQLDVKTGRQLGADRSAAGNGGVWPMDGKLSYVAMNGLAPFLRIKHRVNGLANNSGTPLNGGADYTHMGVTSHGEGASFDIDWILQELEDGEDVEMDLHYQATDGRHYADVVGGGRVLGIPFLLHVSDKQQSDEDPGDNQGTGDVDFEWIKNATGFAANSNAFIDQIISQSVIAEVDSFPDTSAVFELIDPSGTKERVMLRGPATVLVAVGLNGEAVDSDNDGLDQVPTQMVQLELQGNSAVFGPLTVKLRDPAKDPFRVSGGEIEETANTMTGRLDLPPFAPSGTASSFFKIFFEVTVQTPMGPVLLHNRYPKTGLTTISHKPPAPGGAYEFPEPIPLYFEDGSPSGYQIGSTRHTPRLELVPPACTLTWVTNGVDATITDSGGLFSIEVVKKENADVNVPGFPLGSQGPVVVTARKQTPGVRSVVELKITDLSGNMITCDPVLTLQVREDGKPVSETLSSIPQAERLVTVRNGSPGLKNLHVTVNGKAFVLSGLRDGEERTLDITSAMQPGNGNVIVLTAHGKPGGSADVAIHD